MAASQQVVFCRLSDLQLSLYRAFLASEALQALLQSTARKPSGASKGPGAASGGGKGRSASGAGAGTDGGTGIQGKGAEQMQAPPKQLLLAPLAAITALKKLCCHPDLVLPLCGGLEGECVATGKGPAHTSQHLTVHASCNA